MQVQSKSMSSGEVQFSMVVSDIHTGTIHDIITTHVSNILCINIFAEKTATYGNTA
jgi:hypothetical protein